METGVKIRSSNGNFWLSLEQVSNSPNFCLTIYNSNIVDNTFFRLNIAETREIRNNKYLCYSKVCGFTYDTTKYGYQLTALEQIVEIMQEAIEFGKQVETYMIEENWVG